MMIFHQFFRDTADQYLVGNTPEADTRMIVVLDDQLLQLADTVFVSVRVFVKYGDKRNLCPDDKTELIARVIEIL